MAAEKKITKAEAKTLISAIETALGNGCKPPDIGTVGRERSAVSQTAIHLGVHRLTVQKMLKQAKTDFNLEPDWSLYSPEEVADDKDPRIITALRTENNELKRRIKEAHLGSLNDDAIKEILGGIVAAPAEPPKWLLSTKSTKGSSPEVPITIWSDWHCGESVSLSETNNVNEYSKEIFLQRTKRLCERTIDLCINHGPGRYPGIVINILGDMVSGGLHPELKATDEEEVIPAVLTCRDTLITCLEAMIETFGQVYCPCTSGNHGRATHKPEFKRYVYKNFDWLIYQLLARHFAGRKEIVFDIPDSNEVYYRVFSTRYLAMHGDMMGAKGGDGIIGSIGPISRGEMKVGRQQSVIGRDYDILLCGHWHQTLWLPRVIVNNTIKGWDEYAQKSLRAPPSVPSQSLWFEHPRWGKTMHREVFVEDPDTEDDVPWVSIFGE